MRYHQFTKENLETLKLYNINTNIINPFPINFLNKSKIIKINSFNNLIKSRFLPNTIYQEIITYKNSFFFQIDNLFFALFGPNTFDLKKQVKFIQIISNINKFFHKISNIKIKSIYISLYFSPFKKYINEKIIKPININSGLTFNENNIIIYREEEWKKVLIHELIHVYKIDNFKFETVPFINGDDMKYEALTELTALIIHSQLISYLTKKNFNEIINNEIKFNIIQSIKILNLWKITKFEDFNNKIITVKSSPFSYFIYKTELFLNYDTYLKQLENFILPNRDNLVVEKLFAYLNLKDNNNNLRMSLYEIV